jgi:hypothetical protein
MKHLTAATLIAFVFTLVAPGMAQPAQAQGQSPSPSIAIPITGTGGGGTFAGTFNLQRFNVVNGAVNAVGTLTGTLTDAAGNVTSIVRTLNVPINAAATQAACDILHLELGPLNLDLLGLVVNLNRVVLDIDAQPGPGNLLGNLLCAVAGLLDNPNGLANLLNRILAILG